MQRPYETTNFGFKIEVVSILAAQLYQVHTTDVCASGSFSVQDICLHEILQDHKTVQYYQIQSPCQNFNIEPHKRRKFARSSRQWLLKNSYIDQ